MPEADLALLIDAALAAGDIAKRHWRNAPDTWHKPGNEGPVTEADLAVDAMLRAELTAARPDYGWLSEESEDHPERGERTATFIVDPIDGTRSFVAGERTWAHSLAVAHAGEIIAAVVYLPVREKLYAAEKGEGVTLNNAPIKISRRATLAGANVLANRQTMDAEHWMSGPPPVHRHFRSSLAYRMGLVAEGRFDAMVTLRDTWEWDIAAGTLLVAEAGGSVTDRHGNPHRFNAAQPKSLGVIAGPAELGRGIQGALAPRATAASP